MQDPHGPVFLADRDMSDGLEVRCFRYDAIVDTARAAYYTAKALRELARLRRELP